MQTNIFHRVFPGRRSRFALRMAPMIDMIFLLLIFFLVAGKWRPQENFLPFKLPTAGADYHRFGRPEPLTIHIFATRSGCVVRIGQFHTVQIEDQTIAADLTGLMDKIHRTLLDQKRFTTDPIEIICEPQVKWDYLAKIYNLFFGAGLTDITFQMTEYDQDGHTD
jgi:biopolymer transport protein ExbD